MKINTKKALVDFSGSALVLDGVNMTVGIILSKILAGEKSSDPLRAFVLAQKMFTQEEVEIDASEKQFIKDAVKASQAWTPIVTGQILIAVDEVK